MENKIGQGGFGAVYYAELRGEKAAIKKMESQKSREFLTELKVLIRVYHLNLVHLIGYCAKKDSLFLVYEYIDNGNLSQHLRDSEREPLLWSMRVQIALDSARGLEYIHEHTVPVYIHCDIKSDNILIDQNFHAKVADFGLTKLTEVGSSAHPTDNLADMHMVVFHQKLMSLLLELSSMNLYLLKKLCSGLVNLVLIPKALSLCLKNLLRSLIQRNIFKS